MIAIMIVLADGENVYHINLPESYKAEREVRNADNDNK